MAVLSSVRRRWLRRSLFAGFALPLALVVWSLAVEPRRLVIVAEEVALRPWPDGSSLRVAALSDLHVGSPGMSLARLRQVVERTNELQPDVIVLLGDYTIDGVVGGRFVAPARFAPVLGDLAAPHGVYAVLGNHDHWHGADEVRNALEAAGIIVLYDRAAALELGRDRRVWLGGVSDFTEGEHDVERTLAPVPENEPVVLMTHNPDLLTEPLPAQVALTLAGHTHGGQVSLPLIGPPVVPTRLGSALARGRVRVAGNELFVTSGLGTSIVPIRLGVPPEIALLTLSGQVQRGTHGRPQRAKP